MKRASLIILAVLIVAGLSGVYGLAAQGAGDALQVRKAAFLKAPEVKKLAAFRAHLMKAERAGTWTAEQAAVFTLARAALKPGVFQKSAANDAALKTLGATILTHFTKAQALLIFASLDDPDLQAADVRVNSGIRLASYEPKARPGCTCATVSDWCGGGNCAVGDCTGSFGGCGTFWYWNCDGFCGGASCPVP